jgi:hypothetical protein
MHRSTFYKDTHSGGGVVQTAGYIDYPHLGAPVGKYRLMEQNDIGTSLATAKVAVK